MRTLEWHKCKQNSTAEAEKERKSRRKKKKEKKIERSSLECLNVFVTRFVYTFEMIKAYYGIRDHTNEESLSIIPCPFWSANTERLYSINRQTFLKSRIKALKNDAPY